MTEPAESASGSAVRQRAAQLLEELKPWPLMAGRRNQWAFDVWFHLDEGANPDAGRLVGGFSDTRGDGEAYANFLVAAPQLMRDLLAQLTALEGQLAEAKAEAQDWELAADGIKHHFHCANNVVTGDPRGFICDRCRAEAAEGQLAALREERDEAIQAHGIESGFWGRAAAREVGKRKAAEAALAAAQQAHGALRKALERIVDWADCESKYCCENIPVHCPSCIAAVALAAAAAPALIHTKETE